MRGLASSTPQPLFIHQKMFGGVLALLAGLVLMVTGVALAVSGYSIEWCDCQRRQHDAGWGVIGRKYLYLYQ